MEYAGTQLDQGFSQAVLQASSNGRLTCADAHRLAKKSKISRIDMGSACERLDIRIKPCQLGIF